MTNSFRREHALAACGLCPRRCGVDRRRTLGFCRAGESAQVYTYFPHHGEEPPISGEHGSGTIFFSRCTLRCLYCQNYPWSQDGQGAIVGAGGLESIMETLYRQGCHNWNLVTPTPWLADIVDALGNLRRRGLRLPVVYNTGGYESLETVNALDPWVDVYLTDLRYAEPETAAAASQAPDYVRIARDALLEMWRRKGPLRIAADGTVKQGVICRILVLPGHAQEAIDNLDWLAQNIGTNLAVSLMSQYTPAWRACRQPGWDRPLSTQEYAPVLEKLRELGFTTGWVQELESETPPPLIGYNMPAAEAVASSAV